MSATAVKNHGSLELEEGKESANYLRSQWDVCVKSSKMLKRITVVMRSAERVDRIFGTAWTQTEKFLNKVYPNDMNVPKGAVLHPHFYKFNPPITNMGKYSTQLLARALRNRGVEAGVIFASPTLRTLQTAGALAKSTGARILVEPGLLEPMAWYRSAGAKALPEFLDEVFDMPQIDKTYKPIFSMTEMIKVFNDEKSEEQCTQRIMLVVKNICGAQRETPAIIVGHAITMDIASKIGAHGDQLPDENLEQLTSYEDASYSGRSNGQAAKLELGVHYPPASVLALIRHTDSPPHLLKTVPNIIPPMTIGTYSNKIFH